MKKDFYIVVPFDAEEDQSVKASGVFGLFRNFWRAINNGDDIVKIRSQIKNFSANKK